MDHVLEKLAWTLQAARDLNAEGAPTRSRELSLAITKLEEARHWLLDAAVKTSEEGNA